MATTNVTVKLVDETKAGFRRISGQLNGIQGSVGGLTRGFGGLGAAIAGAFSVRELVKVTSSFQDMRSSLGLLYKDVEKGNKAFSDIKQFATESIFSVEDLTTTFIKLKGAGIEPTTKLLNLFQDTAAISVDSIGALQAITDLFARTTAGGLGLEELNRLADRGIPVFDILQKKLGITRLEISKIGQTSEGAQEILAALQVGLEEQFGGAVAARVNNTSQAMSNFGDAVDNALDAIGEGGFNTALAETIKSMSAFIDQNKEIALAIGKSLGEAILFLRDNVKLLTAAFVGYFSVVAVGKIVAIAKAFNTLNMVMGKNVLLKLATFALGAVSALGFLNTETEDLTKEIEKNTDVQTKNNQAKEQSIIKSNVVAEIREKEAKALSKITDSLENSFGKMREELDLQGKRSRMTEEQITLEEELIDIKQKTTDALIRLEEQYASKTSVERERLKQTYENEKEAIIELGKVQEEHAIKAIEFSAQEARAKKLTVFALEQQIQLENEVQAVQDNIAKMTMTSIEKKYYDIERAARNSAKAQIEQEEQIRNAKLSPKEIEEYYNAALKGSEKLKQAAYREYQASRTWSTGWQRAFNEYVENATNAAQKAENIFKKATQGMEDALVNFAKTGKFEWKNFVEMMLEELLRAQIQTVFAQLMGTMQNSMKPQASGMAGLLGGGGGGGGGGLGGLLSGAANFLGFGSGANNPNLAIGGGFGGGQDQSVLGNIFGSIGSGVKTVVDVVGSGIGSVVSGIGDLFGGFFANGGTLGAGKWGIAGESGPELITGPASISPIGGATNITYNISAVDAPSFQALVAKNPEFMYAVTEKGRRTMPTTRR